MFFPERISFAAAIVAASLTPANGARAEDTRLAGKALACFRALDGVSDATALSSSMDQIDGSSGTTS